MGMPNVFSGFLSGYQGGQQHVQDQTTLARQIAQQEFENSLQTQHANLQQQQFTSEQMQNDTNNVYKKQQLDQQGQNLSTDNIRDFFTNIQKSYKEGVEPKDIVASNQAYANMLGPQAVAMLGQFGNMPASPALLQKRQAQENKQRFLLDLAKAKHVDPLMAVVARNAIDSYTDPEHQADYITYFRNKFGVPDSSIPAGQPNTITPQATKPTMNMIGAPPTDAENIGLTDTPAVTPGSPQGAQTTTPGLSLPSGLDPNSKRAAQIRQMDARAKHLDALTQASNALLPSRAALLDSKTFLTKEQTKRIQVLQPYQIQMMQQKIQSLRINDQDKAARLSVSQQRLALDQQIGRYAPGQIDAKTQKTLESQMNAARSSYVSVSGRIKSLEQIQFQNAKTVAGLKADPQMFEKYKGYVDTLNQNTTQTAQQLQELRDIQSQSQADMNWFRSKVNRGISKSDGTPDASATKKAQQAAASAAALPKIGLDQRTDKRTPQQKAQDLINKYGR